MLRNEHHDDLCEMYWEEDAKAWTECDCDARAALVHGDTLYTVYQPRSSSPGAAATEEAAS